MKLGNWVILKPKNITLGDQSVYEMTLLENKKYLSLKFFKFRKTEGKQDRFHTHAFDAHSLLLHGDYIEEVLENETIIEKKRSRKRLLFIPKNHYHRITKSNNCYTLLLTKEWGKEFKELLELGDNNYKEVICGDKRKITKVLGFKKLKGGYNV